MNILVACEESQRVCEAFREKGHRAFSCDLFECSGGHPEWHIKGDCLPYLDGRCFFVTMDGTKHEQQERWDLIIAHPPCTYLTVTGNAWFNEEKYGAKAVKRKADRQEAAEFFMQFVHADCDRVVIENPIGYMSRYYRKPDQIIQPWQFGDNYAKSTCLWFRGVHPLVPEVTVKPELEWYVYYNKKTGQKKRQPLWYFEALNEKDPVQRAKIRSRTFPGVARAMAEQWGAANEEYQYSFSDYGGG